MACDYTVVVVGFVVVAHDVGYVVGFGYLKRGNPRVLLMKILLFRMTTSDFW